MYLSEATTQSNLKIALSVKNLTSCKHWACCLRKMVEHWKEVKTGDFLPLPISLPFLRLPHAGLACNCRLTCPNFGETFCGEAAIQLGKVTFPRWMAILPPKSRSPVRKSEPARRYASYAHMADPASNHGRKSSHSRTKKLHACSYSDPGISKKTKETKFL